MNTFQMEEDVRVELEKLQQKGINVNELLREFLQKRAEEIEEEKVLAAGVAVAGRKENDQEQSTRKPGKNGGSG